MYIWINKEKIQFKKSKFIKYTCLTTIYTFLIIMSLSTYKYCKADIKYAFGGGKYAAEAINDLNIDGKIILVSNDGIECLTILPFLNNNIDANIFDVECDEYIKYSNFKGYDYNKNDIVRKNTNEFYDKTITIAKKLKEENQNIPVFIVYNSKFSATNISYTTIYENNLCINDIVNVYQLK